MINLIEFQLQFNTAALMSILTYSAMSQFWVSSQPPPSDISVPWIILAKQWTKRGTFNQNLINIQYYHYGHYPIQSLMFRNKYGQKFLSICNWNHSQQATFNYRHFFRSDCQFSPPAVTQSLVKLLQESGVRSR